MVIPEDRLFATNSIFQFSVFSLFLVIMQVPYSAAIMAHERMDFYAIVRYLTHCVNLGVVVAIPYISLDRLIFYGTFIALVSLIDLVCYYIC